MGRDGKHRSDQGFDAMGMELVVVMASKRER